MTKTRTGAVPALALALILAVPAALGAQEAPDAQDAVRTQDRVETRDQARERARIHEPGTGIAARTEEQRAELERIRQQNRDGLRQGNAGSGARPPAWGVRRQGAGGPPAHGVRRQWTQQRVSAGIRQRARAHRPGG
jgi:hypothetical protein